MTYDDAASVVLALLGAKGAAQPPREALADALKQLDQMRTDRAMPTRRPEATTILRSVAAYYRVTPATILGRDRHLPIVYVRWVATILMRRALRMSFPDIGAALGGRDHSTVLMGYRKALADPVLMNDARCIAEILGSSELAVFDRAELLAELNKPLEPV